MFIMDKTNLQESSPGAMQVMHRYLTINAQHNYILVLVILFSLLSSGALGIMTQNFQSLIDNFGVTGNIINIQTLILLVSIVVLIPAQYLQQFLGIKYSKLCDRNLHVKTFSIMSWIDMQVLDTQNTGDIISRVNSDLDQINRALQNYFAVRLPQQIIGIVTLVVSILINWQLTLFSLAIVPIFALLQMIIAAPLTQFIQQRQKLAGESLSIAKNLMGGYEVAKAYNMGEMLKKQYNTTVDNVAEININSNRATILLTPLSQVLFFLPQIVICGFGVYLSSINQISPGSIMSVLILSIFIRNPIGDFSSVLSNFKTARACASRIFELWDMAQEPNSGTETQPNGDSIAFSGVGFSYPDKPPVLNDLSFEIHKGERIALVGASGSGKSTAIKLLMALYHKKEGEIKIFGHTIEAWSIDALRENISYVGQDTYLFTGSIWDNIAIGKQGAIDTEIQAVIDVALLDDVDTQCEIGERGLRLSGGQRQRVAIARAMLKNAPLLLLDEPTSALDTQSEAQVSVALQRLMEGRTTIIIAHRLSALRRIDSILHTFRMMTWSWQFIRSWRICFIVCSLFSIMQNAWMSITSAYLIGQTTMHAATGDCSMFAIPVSIIISTIICIVRLPIVGILNLGFLLVSIYMNLACIRREYTTHSKRMEVQSTLTQHMIDIISGSAVARMFGLVPYRQMQYENDSATAYSYAIKGAKYNATRSSLSSAIQWSAIVFTLVSGSFFVHMGITDLGTVVFIVLMQSQINNDILQVTNLYQQLQHATVAATRVKDILDHPDESIRDNKTIPDVSADVAIEFQHVTVSYVQDIPVLKDISLSVKNGERIAIVGGSGGGKTTLIKAIMEFAEVSKGSIALYEHPLEQYSQTTVRELFAYVPQNCYLLDGTIRENIICGTVSFTIYKRSTVLLSKTPSSYNY